jgi:carbonic anhydrase/acetyltransferase-like protein (isoleucine patch superfamily)
MATLVELDGVGRWERMLAAGAVLTERGEVASGMLAPGVPARVNKQLSGSAANWTRTAAGSYQDLRRRYLATSVATRTGGSVAAR